MVTRRANYRLLRIQYEKKTSVGASNTTAFNPNGGNHLDPLVNQSR